MRHEEYAVGEDAEGEEALRLIELEEAQRASCSPSTRVAVGTSEPSASHVAVSATSLRESLKVELIGKDLGAITVKEVRQRLAATFGLQLDGLEDRKDEIATMTKEVVQELESAMGSRGLTALEELLATEEFKEASQTVYFITMAHVLGAKLADGRSYKDLDALTRKAIAHAVVDAFDNPLEPGAGMAGRPRARRDDGSIILFLVVFLEKHEDGSAHFHIVVKLKRNCRFLNAKRTLRERHLLPSHFSCSHKLIWSAIRYCYFATPRKPEVDDTPWLWTPSFAGYASEQSEVDLFDLSQEPYRADSWRKRRTEEEKEASVTKRRSTFEKLDLTTSIVLKHLWSKDSLIAYTQEYGTLAMKKYVHARQRRLTQDIEEAKEWDAARENARFEAIDDWALLCQRAELPCPHGQACCTYHKAATHIFARNQETLNKRELAAAIREILVGGPKKTTRVPFLVGPSNTGKSTLVYPFDDLFGPKRVLHKPALGSTFGLRNLADGTKRFIFWDDFRPVEFAHEKTVPVSLFLSLFVGQYSEIQVSQSFNDGNKDIQWNRGVVFTAKQEGLWDPTKRISAEDIRHMRNRVREFPILATLPDCSLQDVISCAPCMAKWIVHGAAAADAQPALQNAVTPKALGDNGSRVDAIMGLKNLYDALLLPMPVATAMLDALEDLGAICVSELTIQDWQSMQVWAALRPLQKRRLFAHLGHESH